MEGTCKVCKKKIKDAMLCGLMCAKKYWEEEERRKFPNRYGINSRTKRS